MLQCRCPLSALGSAPSLTGSRNRWDCKLPHPCGGGFILSTASKRRSMRGVRREREEGAWWEHAVLRQAPVGKETSGSHGQQRRTGVSGCGWHRASPRNWEPQFSAVLALGISDKHLQRKVAFYFDFLVASKKRICLFILPWDILIHSCTAI